MESHEEGGTQDRTPVGCNADEDMEHVGIESVKDSIDNKNPMTSSKEHMEEGYLQKGSNVAASISYNAETLIKILKMLLLTAVKISEHAQKLQCFWVSRSNN